MRIRTESWLLPTSEQRHAFRRRALLPSRTGEPGPVRRAVDACSITVSSTCEAQLETRTSTLTRSKDQRVFLWPGPFFFIQKSFFFFSQKNYFSFFKIKILIFFKNSKNLIKKLFYTLKLFFYLLFNKSKNIYFFLYI